jgi:hypothetical protein
LAVTAPFRVLAPVAVKLLATDRLPAEAWPVTDELPLTVKLPPTPRLFAK